MHKLITLFSNLIRSRKQSRPLILVKLYEDFVREHSTIQRNLRAELPLATRFRERICSPPWQGEYAYRARGKGEIAAHREKRMRRDGKAEAGARLCRTFQFAGQYFRRTPAELGVL